MKKLITISIISFALLIGITAKSQEEFSMEASGYYEIIGEKERIEIPFEIHNGDILVKPKINGIPSRMYVDNGTIWNEVFFFGSSILDTLDLEYTGDIIVGGAGEGNEIINKMAEHLTLDFGNVVLYNQPAIISPPELGMQNYWTDVDGQISAQFFKHFITEINYDRMVIILHQPKSFKPNKDFEAIPMTLVDNGSFSIPIEIEMNESIILKRDVILDLGGSCTFMYRYMKEDNIDFIENGDFKVLGYGVQGEINGYRRKIKGFKISNFVINDPVGEFVKREQRDHGNSIIGLEMLSQFSTVLDYHNNVLYIKPNQNFNK